MFWFFLGFKCSSNSLQGIQEAVHERVHPHCEPRHRRVQTGKTQQQYSCEEDQVGRTQKNAYKSCNYLILILTFVVSTRVFVHVFIHLFKCFGTFGKNEASS